MEPSQQHTENPACPECGSSDHVIPVIYGKPTKESLERWKRYEVELGGMLVIDGEQPPWTCTECNVLIRRCGIDTPPYK